MMDGDRYASDYLTHRWLHRLLLLLPTALILGTLLLGAWTPGALPGLQTVRGLLCAPCRPVAGLASRGAEAVEGVWFGDSRKDHDKGTRLRE